MTMWEGLTPPYSTIVADPPWPQKGGGTLAGGIGKGFVGAGGASLPMPYTTMAVADIEHLPVSELADRDAHLYLWTTNGFLEAAFGVIRAWGFRYSTTLVWAKNTMGNGLGGAFGISTEFLLFARRGRLASTGGTATTWFNWKRPYDFRGKPSHSSKPPQALDLIHQCSPGPYVELFARSPRLGWDHWGYGWEQA